EGIGADLACGFNKNEAVVTQKRLPLKTAHALIAQGGAGGNAKNIALRHPGCRRHPGNRAYSQQDGKALDHFTTSFCPIWIVSADNLFFFLSSSTLMPYLR